MRNDADPGRGERRLLTRARAVEGFGPARTFSLVFTNGCFDVLHEGHLALLRHAADLGDRLLVGLNSDASVRRLKGAGRPMRGVEARARALLGVQGVDAVTVFDEDTPRALIEALRPDVLVKGADYALEDIVGRDVVERHGGRVVRVPLVPGVSTSSRLGEQADPAPGGAVS